MTEFTQLDQKTQLFKQILQISHINATVSANLNYEII